MGRPEDIPNGSIWVEWEEFCQKVWDHHTENLEKVAGRKWTELSNLEKQTIMRYSNILVEGTRGSCFRISANYLLRLEGSQDLLWQHKTDVGSANPEPGPLHEGTEAEDLFYGGWP